MTIEEILVNLGLDASSFGRGLRQAEADVKGFGEKVKENLKDAFKELAAPLAGVGLIAGVEKIFGKVDEIERASAAAGIGAEEFQRLAFAAHGVGIQSAQVEKSLEFLSKTIGEANAGAKGAEAIFKRWGITFSDGLGHARDASEVLRDVSNAMQGMGDDASKAAMAQDLLGKSGAKLVSILKDGATALHQRGAGAMIFTDGDIDSIKNAKEQIDQTSNSVTILFGKMLAFVGNGAAGWGSIWGGGSSKGGQAQRNADNAAEVEFLKRQAEMKQYAQERLNKIRENQEAAIEDNVKKFNKEMVEYNKKHKDDELKEELEKKKQHEKELSEIRRKHNIAERLALENQEKSVHRDSAYFHTVDELANSDSWASGTARALMRNRQALSEYTLYHGANESDPLFKANRDYNEKLQESLEKGGFVSPDITLAKIQEKIAALSDAAVGGVGITVSAQ